jgi:hypothetical protein
VMDAVQAGMAAAGPALCGFADTPQARTFYSQAVTEAAVIMGTDFSGRFDFAQAELAGE